MPPHHRGFQFEGSPARDLAPIAPFYTKSQSFQGMIENICSDPSGFEPGGSHKC
jgi:hypothetical protein